MSGIDDKAWNPELGGPSLWPHLKRIRDIVCHRYLTLAARVALGGIFIYSGVNKLANPGGFVDIVKYYEVLPDSLATAYGYALPPVELVIGVLLVAGIFLRSSAVVSILMVLSFTIAKGIILSRGIDLPCGCFGMPTPEEMFGQAPVMLVSQTLAIDIVMLLLAFQILFHRGEFLALGHFINLRHIFRRAKATTD